MVGGGTTSGFLRRVMSVRRETVWSEFGALLYPCGGSAMSPSARRPTRKTRDAPAKPGKTPPDTASKPTQRTRLLDAITELSAKGGYQGVSIAQVSAHARVSSATFYELFEGKEDCLLAAYGAVAERMFEQVQFEAPEGTDWRGMARGALTALLTALRSDPDGGRLLFVEAAAGGTLIGEERKRVLAQFEQLVEQFLLGTRSDGERLDLPATALVGAVRSIVSRRLRTNAEDQLPTMVDDLIAWLASYSIPAGAKAWSTSPQARQSSAVARPRKQGERARTRLPRGRHGLPASVVARSQRTRIVFATAEVTRAKGYANTTVADIVAQAGVARDVFYEHFTDKQHAFLEAQQHPTQHIIDTVAAAYFSSQVWPERVWKGLNALLELIASNPAISHLRLVECYAAGPTAIRRAEEITRSFTVFLEEGYSYRPEAQELPRLSSEAITGATFEVIQRHVAREDYPGLVERLPQIAYVVIAPFAGPQEAARLVERLSAPRAVKGRSKQPAA
jgi:AcrR family transcriptional regulator